MKMVYKVEDDDKENVNEVLDEDPISRLSITQRSAGSLGFDEEGSFLILEGGEDLCGEAEDKLEECAEKLSDEKGDEVISAVEEQEEKSMKGFGGVFGG